MDDDVKHWTNLHEKMIEGKVDYNPHFYVLETSQEGQGDITVVTPTQAQVEQAKMQLKRKLSPLKKAVTKRRKTNSGQKKKGQSGGKKVVKKAKKSSKGQRGGKKATKRAAKSRRKMVKKRSKKK